MGKPLIILMSIASIATCGGVVDSFPSPSSDITGLAYENGELWCLDTGQTTVYCLDPSSGSVLFSASFDCFYEPFGLAASNDSLFFCMIKAGGPTTYYGMFEPYSGEVEALDLC
ncbi:MAG: hypothetical protein GF388_01825 [Candidatus Aegiribacteria sp.]|nr:hypothetical protein [Candidatus Aegiribacteria sp.]